MFKKIFIEKEIENHPSTLNILSYFPKLPAVKIDNYRDFFEAVKKPYLQKRDNLNIFIAKKKGQLIKEAPAAYGTQSGKHYYFIHAYNCIYECSYCYLQGYFHSPDLVLFINYEEIANEITKLSKENPKQVLWFHAGEFSDSLALSHLTKEIPFYFNLFKNLPNSFLELRTKSVNIKEIINELPLKNIITTFSLSPSHSIREHDLKTPNLKSRLHAIKSLIELNFPIGIHLDPIIYSPHFENEYRELIIELYEILKNRMHLLHYISLGVVRFTKDVYRQMELNYPTDSLLASEFIKGEDNKIRYPLPMRRYLLQKIKSIAIEQGIEENKLYFCMEDQVYEV